MQPNPLPRYFYYLLSQKSYNGKTLADLYNPRLNHWRIGTDFQLVKASPPRSIRLLTWNTFPHAGPPGPPVGCHRKEYILLKLSSERLLKEAKIKWVPQEREQMVEKRHREVGYDAMLQEGSVNMEDVVACKFRIGTVMTSLPQDEGVTYRWISPIAMSQLPEEDEEDEWWDGGLQM